MTWNPWSKGRSGGSKAETTAPAAPESTGGKGRPTPKRRQAEQENLRPLVPKDRKASRKAQRRKAREEQDREYAAMRTGDVAHMPRAERLPHRIYIRDYVDARRNLSEYFIPTALVIMVVSVILTYYNPFIGNMVMLLLYVYILIGAVDLWLMWHRLKARLVEKFGERAVARGSKSASYAVMRATQIRRWRLPKPSYAKRGHWPR